MAKFDQRGQQVVNQINAETVNFGTPQNKAKLIAEFRQLLHEVEKVTNSGGISNKTAIDIETHIKNVIAEIEKTKPQKKSILGHIEGAKSLLDGLSSATGLVSALVQAAKIVSGFFL